MEWNELNKIPSPHKHKDIQSIRNAITRVEKKVCADNVIHTWPRKTILIASDSMFSQLDGKRLSKNGHKVKVRPFKGSTINDMYHYLYPLLQKQPEYVILHVGTNDCADYTSDVVLERLLLLKEHIELKVTGVKVIISEPMERFDDNGKAMRVRNLIRKLNNKNVPLLKNSNIIRKHIGKKGLHLNDYGNARCAMNIISLIKGL